MAVDIARRELVAGLGAAAAWSSVARAQQSAKLPTIGFLGTPSPSAWTSWTGAFVERLRELGWVEGRTVRVEYRWAEAHNERFAQIAAEFVRLKVDVIVTSGSAGIAVKQATSTIPIVLAVANDPVGQGLVTSLARPGANVRFVDSGHRYCQQAPRIIARGAPRSPPGGDLRRRQLSR